MRSIVLPLCLYDASESLMSCDLLPGMPFSPRTAWYEKLQWRIRARIIQPCQVFIRQDTGGVLAFSDMAIENPCTDVQGFG